MQRILLFFAERRLPLKGKAYLEKSKYVNQNAGSGGAFFCKNVQKFRKRVYFFGAIFYNEFTKPKFGNRGGNDMNECKKTGCTLAQEAPVWAGATRVGGMAKCAGCIPGKLLSAPEGWTLIGRELTLDGICLQGDLIVAAGATDALLEGCYIDGNVTVNADGATLKNCRVTGKVTFAGVTNALLAASTVSAVCVESCANAVLVLNCAEDVLTKGNENLYIIDNTLGHFAAAGNNYFIADGNTAGESSIGANDNVNGDNLTDVDARLPVGADERLLPHGNKEQFVGLPRRTIVRAVGEELTLYRYMMQTAEREEVVVVPPGVYTVDEEAIFVKKHSNTKIYAYGVYAEAVKPENGNYAKIHLATNEVSDLSFLGLTVGYAQQSCGQVYVLEKLGDRRLHVVAGAGMWNAFCKSDPQYFNTGSIGIQRAGTFYALGDFSLVDTSVEKLADGTMLLAAADDLTYDAVRPGDVLTCRLAAGAGTVRTSASANVVFKDFTLYGYAGGFAFYENRNLSGTTYYRVLDTTRAGEIITREEYDRYRAYEEKYGVCLEISVDKKGRCRGSLPHIGSIDATHASFCAQGSQITSSLFENMCDDGTNQNSAHGRLSDIKIEGDIATVIYKGNLSQFTYGMLREKATFSRRCADFRVGDRVFIYTAGGQLVCDTAALSETVPYDTIRSTHPDVPEQDIERFAVTVPASAIHFAALAGYDLTDDHHAGEGKVLIDNMSRSSNYFKMDNMMVQGSRSRGLLIKASNGTVKNCTFRNIAKVAVAIVYEIFWGESGVSENLVIENNLIDHTSYSPNKSIYKHIPIDIMGLGGQSVDEDYLLYKNIRIAGNKFTNRVTTQYPYAIYVQAARDVDIVDNDFSGDVVEGEAPAQAVLLSGAMNINLSGNTYPAYCGGDPARIVVGEHYKNIGGADIGRVADNE